VTLKITKIEDCKGGSGREVYVVMSEHFDRGRTARVKAMSHQRDATAIKGEHMKKIAESIARDRQQVFVLPENNSDNREPVLRDALQRAGVQYAGR